MITSREDLLSAVRLAAITPQGLTIGPVAQVGGKSINFGKVTDEAMRRQLLNKIKLAGSQYFAANVLWLIQGVEPCSVQTPF